jgi:uncharacterized membrane protein YphA (DoxX/SURF4 family)
MKSTSPKLSQVTQFARIAMAIVFFWFGILKVIGVSPANGLVEALLDKTLPFIPFEGFIIFLGIWEALIGLLFLFPKLTKWAFILLVVQMFTTFGPLLFLPEASWQKFLLVPTLEGQYILKNVVLIALGSMIYTLHKMDPKKD